MPASGRRWVSLSVGIEAKATGSFPTARTTNLQPGAGSNLNRCQAPVAMLSISLEAKV